MGGWSLDQGLRRQVPARGRTAHHLVVRERSRRAPSSYWGRITDGIGGPLSDPGSPADLESRLFSGLWWLEPRDGRSRCRDDGRATDAHTGRRARVLQHAVELGTVGRRRRARHFEPHHRRGPAGGGAGRAPRQERLVRMGGCRTGRHGAVDDDVPVRRRHAGCREHAGARSAPTGAGAFRTSGSESCSTATQSPTSTRRATSSGTARCTTGGRTRWSTPQRDRRGRPSRRRRTGSSRVVSCWTLPGSAMCRGWNRGRVCLPTISRRPSVARVCGCDPAMRYSCGPAMAAGRGRCGQRFHAGRLARVLPAVAARTGGRADRR